tara:strand:- start:40 stop:897 length:858 start_codon:yes stop_codon:yes gene_type:complete
MSFTYTQLKQAIEDYTQNDETTFINNLPVFIRTAEERIFKNVQLSLFRKNVSGSATLGDQFLEVPQDYLSSFSLSLAGSDGDKFFLEKKNTSFIQVYTPDPSTRGSPRYYADYDVNNFILAPTPDVALTAELHYYYRPTSLTQSQFVLTMTNVSGSFTADDTIIGGTSGKTTEVKTVPSSTTIDVIIPGGSFTVGETITGSFSGATGTLTSIGADTTLTWLSENAEMAMLYGALIEAYIFMKGEQNVMAMYTQRFQEALVGVKMLGEAKEPIDEYRSGSLIRDRQ